MTDPIDAWHNAYLREKTHNELLTLALDFANVAAYLPYNPMWPSQVERTFLAHHDELPANYLREKAKWEALTPQEKSKNNR